MTSEPTLDEEAVLSEMTGSTEKALPDPLFEPTMTVPAAGKWMGLGRASSYEAAKVGVIPTIAVGRRLLVPTAKFRAILGL